MTYKKFINILIIGVWSTLIFEIGYSYTIDKIGVSLFNILTVLLFITFIFGLLLNKLELNIKVNKTLKYIFLVYLIYWLYSTIGLIYTPEKLTALMEIIQYIEYTIILIITVIYFNNITAESMTKTLRSVGYFSFIILIGLTLYTLVTGTALNSLSQRDRFSISPFDDYNIFVYSLILSILLIFLGREVKKREVLKYTVLMLVIIMIGVLAGSRRTITLYGPISLFIPIILLLLKNQYLKLFKIGIPIVLILFIGFNFATNMNIGSINNVFNLSSQAALDLEQRFERGISFIGDGEIDTTTRTSRWDNSRDLILTFDTKEVFFGKGTRSFFAEDVFTRATGDKDSPHNFILSAFIEGGIVKLVIIVLFVILFTISIFRLRKNADFWSMVFLTVSFTTWFITTLISGLEFFYSKQFILIMLIMYFSYLNKGMFSNADKESNTYSIK